MGTIEDMVRNAPDTGISMHRGPFTFKGTWNQEGARIPGNSNDEWRALGTGHLSPRGLHEGDLEGGLLYCGPRKIC